MLQAMQTKVLEEGKKEEGLYKKFTCYCKNNVGTLEKSIATAKRQPCQFGYKQGTGKIQHVAFEMLSAVQNMVSKLKFYQGCRLRWRTV